MSEKITIVFADDNNVYGPRVVEILKEQPEFELLHDVIQSGELLLQKANELNPMVIITDIEMNPGISGLDVCRTLNVSHPHIRKIVLSMYDSIALNIQLLKAGVRGFLLKNASILDIIQCVKSVEGGSMVTHETVTNLNTKKWQGEEEPTAYELEVLKRIFRQQTTETIGKETFRSKGTVDRARAELKRKARAVNDYGIAAWALTRGYIDLNDLIGWE